MLRWKHLSKARGIVDSSSPGPTTPRNSLSPVFFAAFDHYDMHVLIASNFCLIMFCFQSTRANDSTLIRVNEFAKQTFGQHDIGSCQLDGVPVAGYRLRPSPAASASLPVSQPAALRASGRLTAAAAGGPLPAPGPTLRPTRTRARAPAKNPRPNSEPTHGPAQITGFGPAQVSPGPGPAAVTGRGAPGNS